MELIPWVWAILAVVFAIAEIFTAGFFLICFGVGAAAAAALAFLGIQFAWQLVTFVGVSGVVVVLSRPLANRISNPNTRIVGIDRVLGQQAVVIETIDPQAARGLVRVNRERWSADSVDGTLIAAGTKVLVVAVVGAHLKVKPLAVDAQPH